ncbi:hypothetical protein [Streptomyces sp. NPDC048349]|uniref:hypothetical protein n=1 Tax=Streptomyces sp. NPDC048349 TaxID=3155486 RepID=UPI003444D894
MVITGTAGTKVPGSGQSLKDGPGQRAAHRTERTTAQLSTSGETMSRTARFTAVAAVFAALCAGAVTTTPAAAPAEGSHISASINGDTPPEGADGSINWDTPPAGADASINWD